MTPTLVSFFVILLASIVFSRLFSKMKVPWVVALIAGGILIGPNGLDLFEPDTTIEFFATIGLIFLMFMAGLESRITNVRSALPRIAVTGIWIGIFPAIVGIGIAIMFNYPLQTALLIGIIFISSAIGLMIPQLQRQNIIHSNFGKLIVNSTIAVDAVSLILLSAFLKLTTGTFSYSFIIIYPVLILLVALAAWSIPKFRWFMLLKEHDNTEDLFERELRFVVVVLIGFVVLFELFGLHAIVGAFLAGLVLPSSLLNQVAKAKLHAISYGFFVPVLFITIGANTDISVFFEGTHIVILATSIIAGLIISKLIGGWIAGRLNGFTHLESLYLGVTAIPQLSTSLAIAFLGFGAGLLDRNLLSSIIALVIVTAIIAPIGGSILGRKIKKQQLTVSKSKKPEVLKEEV